MFSQRLIEAAGADSCAELVDTCSLSPTAAMPASPTANGALDALAPSAVQAPTAAPQPAASHRVLEASAPGECSGNELGERVELGKRRAVSMYSNCMRLPSGSQ